jgi:asparaginyl-tRNA synthetase
MNTPRIASVLAAGSPDGKPGTALRVQGWVRTKREAKEVYFLEVNDGSTIKNLQLVIPRGDATKVSGLDPAAIEATLASISTGASVSAEGTLVASQGGNQAIELAVGAIELVGAADPETFPLQKKRHSFEYLREIAHLRPRSNTFSAVARLRNTLAMAIHDYFQGEGFFWVHTPIITASDCEGAGEMFQVTTLDLEALAKADPAKFKDGIDYSRDFFGKKAHLTVSGQLNGETYATALGRIYTFGPTFRAENSNTTRHLAEFWMIEPECAFMDINGNMDLAEGFVKFVLNRALERSANDLDFFNERIQPGLVDSLQAVAKSPFMRITYTEAVEQLKKSGKQFEYPVEWGKDLQSEHERFLTEEIYRCPIMVTGYPKGIKAFYMKLNEDGETVRGMDVLVPRLGEIIGGSEREERLPVLQKRMAELNLDEKDYWWYLDLRRFGSVPHAGFGLGFERLILYCSGMQNIRDVIPFPRTPKTADF